MCLRGVQLACLRRGHQQKPISTPLRVLVYIYILYIPGYRLQAADPEGKCSGRDGPWQCLANLGTQKTTRSLSANQRRKKTTTNPAKTFAKRMKGMSKAKKNLRKS